MNIFLEVFGYVGTTLVIISMTMSSIAKLRIFNICGSIICAIYAILTATWPIAIMNFAMIAINTYHLIKFFTNKHSAEGASQNQICANKGGKCE